MVVWCTKWFFCPKNLLPYVFHMNDNLYALFTNGRPGWLIFSCPHSLYWSQMFHVDCWLWSLLTRSPLMTHTHILPQNHCMIETQGVHWSASVIHSVCSVSTVWKSPSLSERSANTCSSARRHFPSCRNPYCIHKTVMQLYASGLTNINMQ